MGRQSSTSIRLSAELLSEIDRLAANFNVSSRSDFIRQLISEALESRGKIVPASPKIEELPLRGTLGQALSVLKAAHRLKRANGISTEACCAIRDLIDAASQAVLAISGGGVGRNNGVSLRSIAPAPEHASGVRKHDYHR